MTCPLHEYLITSKVVLVDYNQSQLSLQVSALSLWQKYHCHLQIGSDNELFILFIFQFVSTALKDPSLEFKLLDPVLVKRRVIPHFPAPGQRARTLDDKDLVPSVLIKFRICIFSRFFLHFTWSVHFCVFHVIVELIREAGNVTNPFIVCCLCKAYTFYSTWGRFVSSN